MHRHTDLDRSAEYCENEHVSIKQVCITLTIKDKIADRATRVSFNCTSEPVVSRLLVVYCGNIF